MEETNKKPKGFERFLRKVEILGNKIPDPMLMFIVLALAVVVISGICSALGVSAVNPATGEVVEVVNLCSIDGIGDVRLSDVADVEITDNADDSYAKVGGNRAVLLSIYKSSTASTSAVSSASTAAMQTLMDGKDGLHLTTIMDQGDYIRMIVKSVLSNLVEGAVLAILVLALFLKDLRPTLVVAISMPLIADMSTGPPFQ